jgi:hypothetical protein
MVWFCGEGVELHPWNPRIKLHKWHALWSTLKYWPNIPYLPKPPRLSGDTCQQLIGWKIMRLKIIEIKYVLLFILNIMDLKINVY